MPEILLKENAVHGYCYSDTSFDAVVSNDIKELLIIRRLNAIENPYDYKEGILVIVPKES